MRLVRPVAVTQAKLTSDVPQVEVLWSAVTTYGAAAAAYEVIDGVPYSYTSKAGGNLNHQPSLDVSETYWTWEGPTNRWAMFDGTIQTQTVQADSLTVEIELDADEVIDTVRVGNIAAQTLQIVITAPIAGVVYDETFDLTSDSGITDWYAWFTEAPVRLQGKTVTVGAALFPGATVSITLSAPGEDVACGLCVIGAARELGGTQWGAELGFRDLSVKAEDEFGGNYISVRAIKRTGSFTVVVEAGFVDELQRLMELYRGEPVLFIGDDDYDTMAIYGFAKSFRTIVSWPTHSLCSLDLESLA